jgi:hypothetical protein
MLKKKTIPLCATGLFLAAAVLLALPVKAQAQEDCTLTQGYWKTHPEAWPDMLTVGGDAYAREDLIGLLATPPKGDATYILAKQLITAMLNVLNGADAASVGMDVVINEADAWLIAVGLGSWPTGPDREAGIQLAEQLDAFNNGLSGVPHCDDVVVIPPEPEPQD